MSATDPIYVQLAGFLSRTIGEIESRILAAERNGQTKWAEINQALDRIKDLEANVKDQERQVRDITKRLGEIDEWHDRLETLEKLTAIAPTLEPVDTSRYQVLSASGYSFKTITLGNGVERRYIATILGDEEAEAYIAWHAARHGAKS